MSEDLESRIRRLEDRFLISERVVSYAVAVDRRDWVMLAGCFTDPVRTDFSELGTPAGVSTRVDLVARISGVLSGFTVTQHISPNHVIEFDEADPDRAVCSSYMFAQHHLEGANGGDYYLLRGSYENSMLRVGTRWLIEALTQHVSWPEGNLNAVSEAIGRAV